MKKNWFLRIGLIALVLAVATTCLVGGTFAKYTTTVSGNDTIEVARFRFTATDGTLDLATSAVEINLFGNAAPVEATDTVAAGNIAPGVGGTFIIVLDATTTDVDLVFTGSTFASAVTDGDTALTTSTDFISYKIAWGVAGTVEAAGTAAVLPAEFSARTNLSTLDSALTAKLEGFVVEKNTVLVVKVAYEWVDAPANDVADTAIGQGIVATTAIGSTVTIVASQNMSAASGYTSSGAL